MLIYPTIKMAPMVGFAGFGGGATGLSFAGGGGSSEYEFYLWGGGGGGGSQNRIGTSYHTTTYYKCKEGGAGGFMYVKFEFTAGTQIVLTIGGGGRGAGKQGNGTRSNGGFNGGGLGGVSNNDAGGGGGGFTGLFLGNGNSDKTAARAIAISPGGGGGAGGPGYPNGDNDQGNGGGGIDNAFSDGRGQRGTRGATSPTRLAQPGTTTAGGQRGHGSGQYGSGADGTSLNGGDGEVKNNSWGGGGGGGGGWFGGGAGGDDGGNWGAQGGASGSAFVRGSGITYDATGNATLSDVTYVSHTFYKQTYGYDGDGTDNTGSGGYFNMNRPVGTLNPRYPGTTTGFGGTFNTSPTNNTGNDGYMGAIVYRKVGDSNWTSIYNQDWDSSSFQTVLTV